jgi:hypothetical protein
MPAFARSGLRFAAALVIADLVGCGFNSAGEAPVDGGDAEPDGR